MPKTAPPPPSSSSSPAAAASNKRLRATVVSPATTRRRKSYPRGVPGKGSLRLISQFLCRHGGIRHPEATYYPDTLEDSCAYSRQVEEEERRRHEVGGESDDDRLYHPLGGPPLGLTRPFRRHSSWSAAVRSSRSAESDDGTSSDDEFVVYVPSTATAGGAQDRPVANRRSWSGHGRSRYNSSRMSVPVTARSHPHYRRVKSKSSPALSFSGRNLGGPTGGSFLYTLDEDRQVLPKNHERLKKTLSSSI